jgi:hypothetical protein
MIGLVILQSGRPRLADPPSKEAIGLAEQGVDILFGEEIKYNFMV